MKNFKILNLCLLLTTLFLVSCGDDDEDQEIDCATFEWAYSGEDTPDTWSSCNVDCGGEHQSPINIAGAQTNSNLPALNHSYVSVPISILNNGHTLEFEYATGSKITVEDIDYPLDQFHFHTGSEHTVDGVRFPMECHLVHQNESTGDIVVVSVLFTEGAENTFLANFSDELPNNEGEMFSSATTVNINDLLPASGGYYNYSGSLTTPPCSEVVNWFVLRNTVEASSDQLDNFSSILNDNYRPAQALNGRTISVTN